jgi:polar amino acid transport system permease protein
MSKFKPLKAVVKIFVWIIRGVPLMLQLFIVYFLPAKLFDGEVFTRFTATIIAFAINYACYFSEIFRGGIESVSKGQHEAGQVLGMTKSQIFSKVILLQVVKRIVPPMSNEIITLVKDTSLSRIIALQEVIWAGQAFMKGSQGIAGAIWPLFFTAVYYLIFSGILTVLLTKLEQKLDYFR